jgi:AmmeMemoRadiSam system protein B/AmmeMemoRadiSam system protein A
MTLKKHVVFLLILVLAVSLPFAQGKNVRKHLTSIKWYPSYDKILLNMLDDFFKNTSPKPIPGQITGIIAPHAGLRYSGQCAAWAYKQLESRPGLERVILLGISHRGGFYGAAVSSFDANSTPLGEIPVDTAVTSKLAKEKFFKLNDRILQDEHCLETHLPFLQYIQKKLKNDRYKIVPILFGSLDKKDFKPMAEIIKKYITPNTLLIASSDFTHYGANYGYAPFTTDIKNNLTKLDMGMIKLIENMDFNAYYDYKKKTRITMCGFTPTGVLMNILAGDNCKGTLVDYYKSADLSGDYSFSVSYASIVISKPAETGKANRGPGKAAGEETPMTLSVNEKKTLMTIARRTLERHFAGESTASADIEALFKKELTPLLREKSGVFVTLNKNSDLRGCIGTIIGIQPLWDGVRKNALNAAFNDYRFPSLKKKELKDVHIEISVMTPLQPIDDYKKIRLGTDGVIIRKGHSQSVFLPQVATETGWTLDQFLGRLCAKAGLSPTEYRKAGMEFLIFQALVFGEHDTHGTGTKK